MKIRIEIDDSLKEEELVIHCRGINQEIQAIQKAVTDVLGRSQNFILYRQDKEYYVPLQQILFFETSGDGIRKCRHNPHRHKTSFHIHLSYRSAV